MQFVKTGMKARRMRGNIIRYAFLFVSILIVLFPIYWMVITGFKTEIELFAKKQTFFPETFTLHYYTDPVDGIFGTGGSFFTFFLNSMIVSFASTAICLIVGSFAAYSLARFPLRKNWNKEISFWILTNRMIPPIVTIIPMYMIMQKIGLINTHWAMLIVYTAFNLPFVVWMMKAFFQEIPKDLEEAAMVDGDTRMRAFFKVVLPLVAPGLVATSIFCIILTWNEFLFALFLLNSNDVMTLPVGIAGLISQYKTNWGALCAAGTVSILPILFFSFIVQKHLVRGMTLGAVKG